MFDFNVICYEENGTANIEYSIDGKTCIEHNNESGDNTISFTSVDDTDCRDISFSESNHNDDQFVFKKISKSISNGYVVLSSLTNLSVKQKFIPTYNNITTNQSNSIKQLKTVSLLI